MNITDDDGDTPLYTVENIETARYLIEHGAVVDRQNGEGVSVRRALLCSGPSSSCSSALAYRASERRLSRRRRISPIGAAPDTPRTDCRPPFPTFTALPERCFRTADVCTDGVGPWHHGTRRCRGYRSGAGAASGRYTSGSVRDGHWIRDVRGNERRKGEGAASAQRWGWGALEAFENRRGFMTSKILLAS